MNILLLTLIALFSFAKDPAPSLRPAVPVPKMDDKTIQLDQYKDVKMPDKNSINFSCKSSTGVEHKPGTAEYESCMRDFESARIQNKEQKIDPAGRDGAKK